MTNNLDKINGVISKQKLINIYLDYFNNYLTVVNFAIDNNLTENQAIALINRGKYLNQLANSN